MKWLAFCLFLLVFPTQIWATHLVGGEMYYECQGANLYKITLKIYRDCGPNNIEGTGFDPSAEIAVYSGSNGYLTSLFLTHTTPTLVPLDQSNPCINYPTNLCIEEAVYQTTVALTGSTSGYNLVYQRCCRNPAISNIVLPEETGLTLAASIPANATASCNSSPKFSSYPPLVLCLGEEFSYDHSAIDANGDVLVYEFSAPLHGGSSSNPAPSPSAPPPYNSVVWGNGYSLNNQLNSFPAMAINASTGLITAKPTQTGIFVVGVAVKEYRNGVLIGKSVRDFQFYVTSCNPNIVSSIPEQDDPCSGFEVQFQNGSSNASFFHWDFGDGNTSDLNNPVHTYSTAGNYTVTLIANPSWPCADTAQIGYTIMQPMEPFFDPLQGQCILGNSFDFNASATLPASAQIVWDFDHPLVADYTLNLNPNGISYPDSGKYVVKLSVVQGNCVETYSDTVVVFPEIQVNFGHPSQAGCFPFDAAFTDQSISWTALTYLWDFGDGNTSTEKNPMHQYTDLGTFDVRLTISSDSGCIASKTFFNPGIIQVNPSPVSRFVLSPTERDVFYPYYSISDFSAGANTIVFQDDKGNISFNAEGFYQRTDTGWFTITQIVGNTYACYDSSTQMAYLEPKTQVFIPNAFSPNGDDNNEFFGPVIQDAGQYHFYVFSRWGELIFESKDPKYGWDGIWKNKAQKPGVYFYKLAFQDVFGEEKILMGSFTLVQ